MSSVVSSDAPAWGRTHLPETPYAIAASAPRTYSETPHTGERHRHHTPSTRETPHAHAAPTHRRRSLFQELAKKFSECGSAKKGGDLGMFRRFAPAYAFPSRRTIASIAWRWTRNTPREGPRRATRRGKMSAAFELAAFNLDVHELSKTVASSSGVHLIYRVA